MSLIGLIRLKKYFILDDFMLNLLFLMNLGMGLRFGQKGGIRLQKFSNLPTKNNMT